MPMGLPPAVLEDRVSEWLSIVGRLRPGIDARRAQADLLTTSAVLASAYPKTNANERIAVRPLLDEMVGGVRQALWLGGAAVVFVLLAGAANAANLMIARATLRRDELAIRAALGAEPARIARQLMVESLLLAACGGAMGIGAARVFDRTFVALADGRVPRIAEVHLNLPAVAVAVVAAAVAALICGGASAWVVVRRNRTAVDRSVARVTASNRVGELLLACQVAFAFVLIAGSVLVARGYITTVRIDPGFDTRDTLTMQATLPRGRYPDAEAHARFAQRAVEALASVPGVTQAGVVSDLPLVGNALAFRSAAGGDRRGRRAHDRAPGRRRFLQHAPHPAGSRAIVHRARSARRGAGGARQSGGGATARRQRCRRQTDRCGSRGASHDCRRGR
jgi:putative ABC transport system permease protein